MIDLDELEKLEPDATPAPWCVKVRSCRCGSCPTSEIRATVDGSPNCSLIVEDCFSNCFDADLIIALRNAAPELIKLARWAERAKVAIERNIEGDYEYFLTDVLKDYPQVEGE